MVYRLMLVENDEKNSYIKSRNSSVLPTSQMVYQPSNHRNLRSIAFIYWRVLANHDGDGDENVTKQKV